MVEVLNSLIEYLMRRDVSPHTVVHSHSQLYTYVFWFLWFIKLTSTIKSYSKSSISDHINSFPITTSFIMREMYMFQFWNIQVKNVINNSPQPCLFGSTDEVATSVWGLQNSICTIFCCQKFPVSYPLRICLCVFCRLKYACVLHSQNWKPQINSQQLNSFCWFCTFEALMVVKAVVTESKQ